MVTKMWGMEELLRAIASTNAKHQEADKDN